MGDKELYQRAYDLYKKTMSTIYNEEAPEHEIAIRMILAAWENPINKETWCGILPDKPEGEGWVITGGEACFYTMERWNYQNTMIKEDKTFEKAVTCCGLSPTLIIVPYGYCLSCTSCETQSKHVKRTDNNPNLLQEIIVSWNANVASQQKRFEPKPLKEKPKRLSQKELFERDLIKAYKHLFELVPTLQAIPIYVWGKYLKPTDKKGEIFEDFADIDFYSFANRYQVADKTSRDIWKDIDNKYWDMFRDGQMGNVYPDIQSCTEYYGMPDYKGQATCIMIVNDSMGMCVAKLDCKSPDWPKQI